ncbi:MAG: hypothetical protein QNK04_18700 [Myxococcota bacterium]|nr:hypothetical protein [Myxococcota bacterium]
MKRIAIVAGLLALLASAAPAEQLAYVLNEDSRDVTIFDLDSGSLLGHFRTKSNPRDLEPSRDGQFVVVAANNDITILASPNYARVDLLLTNGGSGSSSVGLSPDDSTVYVAQEFDDVVFSVDLQHPDTQACIANETEDCYLHSNAQEIYYLPINDPLHLTVCDDGAVTVVGRSGHVARLMPGSSVFDPITVPVPLPEEPRGIDCAPDNEVWISSQNGAPLTMIGPGASPVVHHFQGFSLQDAGRVAVDPRMIGTFYTVLVTDRGTGEILFVENGAVRNRLSPSNGSTPFGVAASATGFVVAADQDPDSAMVRDANWAQSHQSVQERPIDSGIGPVAGPAVEATPHELQFSYFQANGVWTAPKTMTLESTGTWPLVISGISVPLGGSNFQIVSQNCTNRTLQVGDSCEVQVRFRPTGYWLYGTYSGTLRVQHNGIPTSTNDFRLRGLHAVDFIRRNYPVVKTVRPPYELKLSLD